MPRLTAPLAAAVSLCLLSPLPAQTLRERPLVYHGLVYLGDEALHKELRLSAEQVKKVAAFREKWLPRFIAAWGSRTRARAARATEIGREAGNFLAARPGWGRRRVAVLTFAEGGGGGRRATPAGHQDDFGRNAFTTASFVVRYGPSIRSMQ
jgi:hypothetical protein